MTQEKSAEMATQDPKTTTPNQEPSGQKARTSKKPGRSKKAASADEKVSVNFSFTPAFAKKLKMLGGGLPESLSEYLEARLASIVAKDLKKILEEMG